jgi:hypothetical protein
MRCRLLSLFGLGAFLAVTAGPAAPGQEPKDAPPKKEADAETPAPKQATLAKNPKPLSANAKKALDFLVKQQAADGGWSGGPAAALFESVGGKGGKKAEIDAANTSAAALALLRAGYSPKKGPYAENLRKAIHGVIKAVEDSDKDSLRLATTQGTQIQRKIGDNADTYLSAILLASAKGSMPDAKSELRLENALQKVVDKMEKNQKEDGTWNGAGWAPVLSQALASRAINMARQVGMAVDGDKLDRTAKHAKETFKQQFITGTGTGKGGRGFGGLDAGNAGVDLYSAAATLSAMQDAVNTHRILGQTSQSVLRSNGSAERQREDARRQLAKLDEHEKALREALRVVVKKIQDGRFVNGFGSDGGEEFISFALLTEALLANNMKEFGEWDKAMAGRLQNTQNATGSWSGKHCITGETFCTAAALMTMTADRAFRATGTELVSRSSTGPATTTPTSTRTTDPKTGEAARDDLPGTNDPAAVTRVNDAEKLLRNLLNGEGDRAELLAKLRDGKGADFTDALATAAAKLPANQRAEAHEALARRLTRMTADTLRRMLRDEDVEVRRAAARACALKEQRVLVPDLIPLLSDAAPAVGVAGHTALRALTGQDFGPAPEATPTDKARAILAWKGWWAKQGGR